MKKLIILLLLISFCSSFASEAKRRNSNHVYVVLVGKDFKDCVYVDNKDCALARGVKRWLRNPNLWVSVGVDHLTVYSGCNIVGSYHIVDEYGAYRFRQDDWKADYNNSKFVDEVELIPY